MAVVVAMVRLRYARGVEHHEFQSRWREGTLDPRPRVNESSRVSLPHLDPTQRTLLELHQVLFVLPVLFLLATSSHRAVDEPLKLGLGLFLAAWFVWKARRFKQDLILERAATDSDFFVRMCSSGVLEIRPQQVRPTMPPSTDAPPV
jgi:hypothetical protein